ncbi:MAG: hypothetical protein K0Q72_4712 [Armatimonadetes bacterium]|jgi:YHS domain-containing protein|nr:hypothetical protein [Armatimonadota bacterium]
MTLLHRCLIVAGLAGLAGVASAQNRVTCVVDRKPATKGGSVVQVNRKRLTLCSVGCATAFRKQPEKYLEKVGDCPVLHNPVAKIEPAGRLVLNNGLYYFCCGGCKEGFLQSAQHLKKLEDVVTGEVFTASDLSPRAEFKGQHYLFVTEASKASFEKTPDKFAVLFAK